MAAPDISYLTQVADFLVTYGPWAVAIFEALYILKIQRDYKKERAATEAKRAEEREGMIKRHEEYHEEIVELVRDASNSKAIIAGRMLEASNEIKIQRKSIEQFWSLITEGVVKIIPIAVGSDVEDILKELAGEPHLKFKKIRGLKKEEVKEEITETNEEKDEK